MRVHLLAFAVSAMVIAGTSGAAKASNVTSLNPQSIVAALQNAGYKASLSKDDDGDPLIETASDGNPIRILMIDCKDHKSCGTTEFVGPWDCSDNVEKCKAAAAETNAAESPVHVLLVNGGKLAATYMYLLYDDAGISEALLIKNLTTFSYYNNQFTALVAKK
jgi:hypothetical protein